VIHINVSCDKEIAKASPERAAVKCNAAIGCGFDSDAETFGDLVVALRGIGWHVDTDGESRRARCLCPDHAPR
jgi:hypothetical protein